FSAGGTTGDGGMNYSTHGSTSGKNAGGVSPMLGQSETGSDSATTKSGISAGTVTITDSAKQKQDVASLNRDTTDANATVGKLPDMQNLLSNQADMMAAASAAGEAVSRRIGDYADKMKKDAAANGDQAGVDAWKEGGANRALMQGAGAALMTGIAGGNAVGGAAGAAIASIASGKLNELSSAIAGSDPTGNADMNQALGNIVANALATGMGAAVGANAGAAEASSVDLYNRSAHDNVGGGKKPKDLVSQVCGAGAQCSDATLIAAIQAQGDLAQEASGLISPNYVTLNFGVLSGSAGGVVNLDDGTKYLAVGVGQSNPSAISWLPGGGATLGWIWGARGADATNAFLNGDGNQAFVSIPTPWRFNVVGAVTHAYGGSTAIEIGVGSPGGSSFGIVPWNHSMPVGNK
ncbi:polymorphic toxin type 22 domain-containing protein, partial [Burkholderia sp. 3C]